MSYILLIDGTIFLKRKRRKKYHFGSWSLRIMNMPIHCINAPFWPIYGQSRIKKCLIFGNIDLIEGI